MQMMFTGAAIKKNSSSISEGEGSVPRRERASSFEETEGI